MACPFHDLPAAYAWLDGQVNYELLLGKLPAGPQTFALDGFRRRLDGLGNPQRALRTIHIAGTRGKGSAALALEALLQASGLRTAVYTSPHLREYRERIRIDGQPISGAEFAALLGRIAQADEALGGAAEAPQETVGRPFKTVFETLTALFFLAARELAVDWAIVETGLGGRLDATNVLEPGPVLLTRIGLEHTHLLGDTLAQIAGEKAAILKPGGWGVMAAQEASGAAEAVFRARAAEVEAPLARAAELCPLSRIVASPTGLRVEIEFEGHPLSLDLRLWGHFQAENIQNALALLTRLRAEALIPVVADALLVQALERLEIPGRMEKVCAAPEVFVDGGHCPTAAAALARTMQTHFGDQPAGLIVGMMQDKDHEGFFRELARWPHWQWVWCYQGSSPRAMAAEALGEVARRHFRNIHVYQNIEQILQILDRDADNLDRVIATGSLYSIARFEEWGRSHGSASQQTQTPAQAEQIADRGHPGA